jgi:pSer/pThr/pTyr-binding forkhead associated (FHA) protein
MAALKLVWAERNLSFDISSQQRLKIGRGQNNDIILPDQLVSSQHAVVQGGFLEDLGSTNGTYVNGQLVEKRKKIKLKENDEVVLGDTLVRIGE